MQFTEAFTFGDVSLVPAYSAILPTNVDTSVRLREITLRSPIFSAAMDTVTTAPMAIAMAEAGGLGVIHKNLSIAEQVQEVLSVKNYQTIKPTAIAPESHACPGADEHTHATLAARDHKQRLICAAAVSLGADLEERAHALVQAGVDALVVDAAHGHSANVANALRQLRGWFPEHVLIGGNVVTEEGAIFLHQAGADAIKVGVGPGSICITRVVAGVGIPQLSAIMQVGRAAKEYGFFVIADGGLQFSGDITKALGAGAHAVMTGSLLAGTTEAPGELVRVGGREYKVYRGMGSVDAMSRGAKDRYGQTAVHDTSKLVPEGIEGRIPFRGRAGDVVFQLIGGLRSGMGYVGAATIPDLHDKARFIRVSPAGLREGHVHNVTITKETPNYHVEE